MLNFFFKSGICNPPDFKFYLIKIINKNFLYRVIIVFCLFSVLFCIVSVPDHCLSFYFIAVKRRKIYITPFGDLFF